MLATETTASLGTLKSDGVEHKLEIQELQDELDAVQADWSPSIYLSISISIYLSIYIYIRIYIDIDRYIDRYIDR